MPDSTKKLEKLLDQLKALSKRLELRRQTYIKHAANTATDVAAEWCDGKAEALEDTQREIDEIVRAYRPVNHVTGPSAWIQPVLPLPDGHPIAAAPYIELTETAATKAQQSDIAGNVAESEHASD